MANSTDTPVPSNVTPINPVTQPDEAATAAPASEPTRMEKFAKSSTGAKLSGTFNQAAGSIKKKLGELTDDPKLKQDGRNQVLLGKVHELVGSLREVRETVLKRVEDTRKEGRKILRKHGGKLLDQAIELVDDVKKTIFK
jgi:uncharacterized protein YjbJ (UPF0337 family)